MVDSRRQSRVGIAEVSSGIAARYDEYVLDSPVSGLILLIAIAIASAMIRSEDATMEFLSRGITVSMD